MKRLILFILMAIPFCVKAQNPVIISQPYKFQKYVKVVDSLTEDYTVPQGDSTHLVPNTAWIKRNLGGAVNPPNGIVSGLTLTLVNDSSVLVSTGVWRINNVQYSKGTTTLFTPLIHRDSIYSRYVTFYANTSNQVLSINGVLSPNPIEPTLPANTVRIGSALITPTGTTLNQPSPSSNYVYAAPTVKQQAFPIVRALTTDTLTVGGVTYPSIDGVSGQSLVTDGAGHVGWAYIVYTNGFGMLLNSNVFSVDTTKMSTIRGLVDTINAHSAYLSSDFKVSGDTLYVADTLIKDHLLIRTLSTTIPGVVIQSLNNPGYALQVQDLDGNIRGGIGTLAGFFGTGLHNWTGEAFGAVNFDAGGSSGLGGYIDVYKERNLDSFFRVRSPGHVYLEVDSGKIAMELKDTSGLTKVLGYDPSTHKVYSQDAGGGGGGNTIYTASDTLTSDRLVGFATHELVFGDQTNLGAYLNINPKQTFPNMNGYVTDIEMNTFTSWSINRGAAQLQHSDYTNSRQGSFTASEAADVDTVEYATMSLISGGLGNQMSFDSHGAMEVTNAIAHNGLKYHDSSSYDSLDTLGLPPLGLVRKQVPTKRHTIYTPASDDTIVVHNNTYTIVNPASGLANLILEMPLTPHNGDCVYIRFIQAMTNIHYDNATFAADIQDNGCDSNTLFVFVYDEATSTWY